MKKALNHKNALAILILILSATGFTMKNDGFPAVNTSLKKEANFDKHYDPTGVWDYTVITDEGDITGEMTIELNEDGDEYLVTIETTDFGTLELEEVELKDAVMTANVEVDGDDIEFEFEFDKDTMAGTVYTPDGELDMEAERKKGK